MASLNDNLFTRFVDHAGLQQFECDQQIQWCALKLFMVGIGITCLFFKDSTVTKPTAASACRRYLCIAYQPLKRCLQISCISLEALALNSRPTLRYWKHHSTLMTYRECAAGISYIVRRHMLRDNCDQFHSNYTTHLTH